VPPLGAGAPLIATVVPAVPVVPTISVIAVQKRIKEALVQAADDVAVHRTQLTKARTRYTSPLPRLC
jgi:hypothetical protein